MKEKSVHCVVTSPPYWALRDYGVSPTIWPQITFVPVAGLSSIHVPAQECALGLEPDPWHFVAHIVHVFREVRRVLRDDGTIWVNLGDTVKDKDLVGIPQRCAFALQADGWYWRSGIIWAKGLSFCETYAGSVLPESVTDRPTKSHEDIFLLAKNESYFFDQEAVKEAASFAHEAKYDNGRDGYGGRANHTEAGSSTRKFGTNPHKRNLRTVWAIKTRPFPGAHFATFPPELVEPCIKAGTSEKGVCPDCGTPYVRTKTEIGREATEVYVGEAIKDYDSNKVQNPSDTKRRILDSMSKVYEFDWKPGCECGSGLFALKDPIPAIVLDPFGGSGTTILVAGKLGRSGIGIELNPEYANLAADRIADELGLSGGLREKEG
jgi:DNA modification methylase